MNPEDAPAVELELEPRGARSGELYVRVGGGPRVRLARLRGPPDSMAAGDPWIGDVVPIGWRVVARQHGPDLLTVTTTDVEDTLGGRAERHVHYRSVDGGKTWARRAEGSEGGHAVAKLASF